MNALVRLRCGATGIYIGHGHGLFVSAQDNDLCIDFVDPDRPPQEGLPTPSDRAVHLAQMALRAGYGTAKAEAVEV